MVDKNVLSHLELKVCPFAVAKCLHQCLLVVQRTIDKGPFRSHLRNPVIHLYSLVAFQYYLVEIRNIKPEMSVISEVQVEGAQLRIRYWCVVDGVLDYVQQSQSIGGRPQIRLLLLRQDNCTQYLLHDLIGSLRCTIGLGVER